jgi:antitoxin component YwqK of YwqJK toxin-antitoxin module
MRLTYILVALGIAGLSAGTLLGQHDGVKADDAQTTYFADGRVQTRYEVHDGKKDGLAERWYADGTKAAEGRYEQGRMEGQWTFWHADGSPDPERSGQYHAGEKQAP